jgi:hypothetical protein
MKDRRRMALSVSRSASARYPQYRAGGVELAHSHGLVNVMISLGIRYGLAMLGGVRLEGLAVLIPAP